MAKLVDALDLGSCGVTRKSSNLFTCTNNALVVKNTCFLVIFNIKSASE